MKKPRLQVHHAKPRQKKGGPSIRRVQMEKILAVWEQFPSLRLGQLLINATGKNDIYYVKDENLVEDVSIYPDVVDFERKILLREKAPLLPEHNDRNFPREGV